MMKNGCNLKWAGMLAVALLAAGCAGKPGTASSRTGEIRFSPTVTRAAVSSLGEGDAFDVWAREDAVPILSQERVACTGGLWNYANTRYWREGAVYDFRAVYPDGLPNVVAFPSLEIADFDARNSVDLMAAEETGVAYAGTPSPVSFSFRHLLARLEFVGRTTTPGTTVTLGSAKLYGMPASGSCRAEPGGDRWTFGPATTAADPFRTAGETVLTAAQTTVLGDVLLFPQTVGADFVLEISYPGADGTMVSRAVALPAASVPAWEAGKSYRYTFTVAPNEYILFDKPVVEPWSTATGGIIPVE